MFMILSFPALLTEEANSLGREEVGGMTGWALDKGGARPPPAGLGEGRNGLSSSG